MKKYLFLLLITPVIQTAIPKLETLSLEEKIGQLFVVATVSDPIQNRSVMQGGPYDLSLKHAQKMIIEYGIGGIIFLGQSTPAIQVKQTNELQALSKIPLIFAQDCEWGLAMRHTANVITYPKAMTLGALAPEDDPLIYQLAKEIGTQCRAIGITATMAPDADVNSEPKNPIIGARSFGQDPERVAKKATLFMDGMRDAGILTSAKHWPGHGNTTTDSHHTLPMISRSKDELETIDLVPFKELIAHHVDSVMTGHLCVPALTNDEHLPVPFSKHAIHILRHHMNHTRLIITDGLGMRGITKNTEPGEPELRALLAGHDMLLCPVNVALAIANIKKAIEKGILSEQELDEHVERILQAKKKLHIQKIIEYDPYSLTHESAQELKQKLYQATITLLHNNNQQIPLTDQTTPLLVITQGDVDHRPFIEHLKRYCLCYHEHLPNNAPQESYEHIYAIAQKYNTIIFALHVPGRSGMIEMQSTDKPEENTKQYIELINQFADHAFIVLFGSPYNLAHLDPSCPTIIAYETEPEAQIAAADTIFGRHIARGVLPATSFSAAS